MYKFMTYVVYLISSIYLHNEYYNEYIKGVWEKQFKEIDY